MLSSSCGLHASLIAITLEVYLVQHDRTIPQTLANLNPPTRLLYEYCTQRRLLDGALNITITLEVYLVQHDRILPQTLTNLKPPARLLYEYCTRRQLPALDPETLAQLRDNLARSLAGHDSHQLPEGRHVEFTTVFDTLFRETNQSTFIALFN
jgi:hypothetical protein